MQKLFFILIGIIFLNSVEAQKYCKPNGYAFSIMIQPGTIPVDENGRPVKRNINKERFIYIMSAGKVKPVINSISYGQTAVKSNLLPTAEKEFSAVHESTQKKLNILPVYGNSMWRINIQEIAEYPILGKVLPIIIKGKMATKPFVVLIYTETPLQGLDRY